jgi:type II secretory pathway pseudopilin PulG
MDMEKPNQEDPEPIGPQQSANNHGGWRENTRLCIEGIGLLALIVYTTFAAFQWRANEKAANAAKSAAQTATQTLILDQRAWVGVETMKGVPDVPEVGKSFDVDILFRNTGRTPARNVLMYNIVKPSKAPPDVNAACASATPERVNQSLIAPNATLTQVLHPTDGKPLAAGWERALASQGSFWVFGCVTYDDTFGRAHWLTYCGVLNQKIRGFDRCKKYNDTGDGKAPPE